jgi:protocatechuate 3,4-dioxygenase beta subunit
LLGSIGRDRAETLLARPAEGTYRCDLHLQGDKETTFFAW